MFLPIFAENSSIKCQTRCLFHTSTASSPELSLGTPRSSVASGAGLEPGAPRAGRLGKAGGPTPLFAATAASCLEHLQRLFNAQRSGHLAGRIFPERLQELPHDGHGG